MTEEKKSWEWTHSPIDPKKIAMAGFMSSLKYLCIDARAKADEIFRRDRAFVRNWRAVPIIHQGKAGWVLTFERRRFGVYVPVTAAFVDTLDECKALVEHRYKQAVALHVRGDGKCQDKPMSTGEQALSAVFKVMFDATSVLSSNWEKDSAEDELRPERSTTGTTTQGRPEESNPQAGQEALDRETQGGGARETKTCSSVECSDSEEVSEEVSLDSTQILDGRGK